MPDPQTFALEYARRGWCVFPMRAGAKVPAIKGWQERATCDESQIREWWPPGSDLGIGIAIKKSRLIVLDIDTKEDQPGWASYEALGGAEAFGDTLTADTPTGGAHFVYRAPEGPTWRGRVRPGVDVLGSGLFIVAPSTHPAGGQYAWQEPREEVVECPPALLALYREAQHREREAKTRGDDGTPFPEGTRDKALTRVAGTLRRVGLEADEMITALALVNQKRCRPPLPESDVHRIAHSVATYEPESPIAESLTFAAGIDAILNSSPPEGLGLHVAEIARNPPAPLTVYPTKHGTLNALIGGGLLGGKLHILSAPPGSGKSAFAIEAGLTVQGSAPMLLVSTELDDSELAARAAAPMLDMPWRQILLEPGHWPRAVDALVESRLHVIGSDRIPRDQLLVAVRAELTRLAELYDAPPILVLDYMQDAVRFAGDDKRDLRERVAAFSGAVRKLAADLMIPVVVVSSVSRAHYGTAKMQTYRDAEFAEIYMSAAKEAGDIDFDAVTMIFLDVDTEVQSGGTRQGDHRYARAAVAKARYGQAGFVGMRFFGATGKWEESPEALEVMNPEAKKEREKLKSLGTHKKEIIECVQGFVEAAEAAGQNAAKCYPSKSEIAEAIGLHATKTGQLINQLVKDGVLRAVRIENHLRGHRTGTFFAPVLQSRGA